MFLLGYLLATVVGFSLGALGAGGALFAIPIFVYIWHFQNKQAVASAFVIVVVVGLLSAWKHLKEGNINFKLFAIFAPTTMLGAYAGVLLSQKMSESVHLLMLSLVMVSAALLMLLPHPHIHDHIPERGEVEEVHPALMISLGLAIGVLVGVVGIGGGFIMLPILVNLAHVPMRQAIGTTLLVSVMNSAVGAISSLRYTSIPWDLVLPFAAIAVVGGLMGAYFNTRVSLPLLRKAVSVLLMALAGAILYENITFITHEGHFLGLALNQSHLR